MSERAEIRTKFRSVAAIRAAAKRCGLQELEAGRVPYYGGSAAADLRFTVEHSRFEIGFTKAADGSYSIVGDSGCFGGSYGEGDPMRAALGERIQRADGIVVNAPRLAQAYAAAASRAMCESQGRRVLSEQRSADGKRIRIEIEV